MRLCGGGDIPVPRDWLKLSRFLVKFFKKKYGLNSRISNDIDIKLGTVTKLDKGNTATSKKFDGNVM